MSNFLFSLSQKGFLCLCISIAVLITSSCTQPSQPTGDSEEQTATQKPTVLAVKPEVLKIMTHDSFAVSEQVFAIFESQNNIKVQIIKSGDTGTALNKAILSKDKPIADVFYGVDNTFLSRALDEDIYEPYSPDLLESIPENFKLDPLDRALPVDYGDVCLNYDKNYFTEKGLQPPHSLGELLNPEYKGLLVVQNPATSSPGLAFLLATIGNFGEAGYLDFWRGLVENEVLVVNDWETSYYTEFSASSGKGPRPIVVSYSSSPAYEKIYAESPTADPPSAAIAADNTCFRQIEFVGILRGAENRELAEKWIDFMLSPPFQEDMPLQMFVFPVNQDAQLDQVFLDFLVLPQITVNVNPQDIAENREKWIRDWTETILR